MKSVSNRSLRGVTVPNAQVTNVASFITRRAVTGDNLCLREYMTWYVSECKKDSINQVRPTKPLQTEGWEERTSGGNAILVNFYVTSSL